MASQFSLGFEQRLHHPWQFRLFFNNSRVLRLSQCTVFAIRNDLGHFRLGITLKARGSSIERNRVKRQIREGFRKRAPLLGGFDYNVVIPGSKRLAFPFDQSLASCLDKELENALARFNG